jgi:hypothetical protein
VPFYYEREPRFAGETKYPFPNDEAGNYFLALFSKKPLKIATYLGFFT